MTDNMSTLQASVGFTQKVLYIGIMNNVNFTEQWKPVLKIGLNPISATITEVE